MTSAQPLKYDYTPHPKQAEAHNVIADELLFGGSAGGGKLLAASTPVLTPSGWTTHGALKPGDQVYGHDGQPVNVLASYSPETSCHYLVEFSTGETIRAGREHLWTVQTEQDRARYARTDPAWKARRRSTRPSRAKSAPQKGDYQAQATARMNRERAEQARLGQVRPSIWEYTTTVESHELEELVRCERKKVTIPSPGAINTTGKWLAVTPPWVLGMWLGDGHTKSGVITQGDEDIESLISEMSSHGYDLHRISAGKNYTFRYSSGDLIHRHITKDMGHSSTRFKHIPEWVYQAPYDDRLALLQGILDSDGHVNNRGQVELSLSDERLCFDVSRLLGTLGIRVTPNRGYAGYGDVQCKDRWRIKFTTHLPVCRYPRKQSRLKLSDKKSSRTSSVYITKITKVPADEPANCITVDDPQHIYLAGRTLIPTHNSRWARAEAVSLALQVPNSRQVFFRRTFPDLQRSVEEEMKKEIPQDIATYNHSKHVWTFANGSIIELAHLQKKDDVLKYQGAEYQTILFEELTHFTRYQYMYMKSRLRAAGAVRRRMKELGLRPRILATANPGGPGHHFVKKRFVDPAPADTIFRPKPTLKEPRPGTRIYIPSRVTDNPSVNSEYIDQLNALPDTQRRALLEGDWDVLDGVRFPDWSQQHHVIRPEQLPMSAFIEPGQKVIAVDFGINDPFVALWMVKLTDDLVVVYREARGTDMTPTQQAELIRELSAEEEEQMGRPIPVVADPSMWNRATHDTRKAINPDTPAPGSPAYAYMKTLGRTPHKAYNARVNGWSLIDEHLRVREDGLPRMLAYDTCRYLIQTLPALPRDKKNPNDADTHADDHACFVTGTMVQSEHGPVPIENIGAGDWVWTRQGLRRVLDAGVTARDAVVGEVVFSNGARLVGTANHPIFSEGGTVPLDALRYGDSALSWEQSPSHTKELSSADTQNPRTSQIRGTTDQQATTSKKACSHFTGKSGKTTTAGKSLTGTTFTTLIMTPITMTRRTLSCSEQKSTWSTTLTSQTGSNTLKEQSKSQENTPKPGTAAQRDASGIVNTVSKCSPGEFHKHSNASNAVAITKPSMLVRGHGSAATRASQRGEEHQVSMMSPESVRTAEKSSPPTSTGKPGLVPVSVVQPFEETGKADVYNLKVEGEPEYFANDVLVHNCDALRYGAQFLAGKRVLTAEERRASADNDSLPSTVTAGVGAASF